MKMEIKSSSLFKVYFEFKNGVTTLTKGKYHIDELHKVNQIKRVKKLEKMISKIIVYLYDPTGNLTEVVKFENVNINDENKLYWSYRLAKEIYFRHIILHHFRFSTILNLPDYICMDIGLEFTAARPTLEHYMNNFKYIWNSFHHGHYKDYLEEFVSKEVNEYLQVTLSNKPYNPIMIKSKWLLEDIDSFLKKAKKQIKHLA